jgi:secreted Zn-dependent insulinase-like peptidase
MNIVIEYTLTSLFYSSDRVFEQPKLFAIITLALPSAIYNSKFVVQSKIFTSCLLDSINEYLYDAALGTVLIWSIVHYSKQALAQQVNWNMIITDLGGLAFELNLSNRGLQLTFSGFNDKMSLFIRNITQKLQSFSPSQGYLHFKYSLY